MSDLLRGIYIYIYIYKSANGGLNSAFVKENFFKETHFYWVIMRAYYYVFTFRSHFILNTKVLKISQIRHDLYILGLDKMGFCPFQPN